MSDHRDEIIAKDMEFLQEEIDSLRQRLAAAEKERDEAMQNRNESIPIIIKRAEDAEAKLSLYESAPSEPEVKGALHTADSTAKSYGSDSLIRTSVGEVLARALRACQAKLAEAQSRIPEQEISDARLMAEKHEDRALVADRRAEKAESELAAARAKIEEARLSLIGIKAQLEARAGSAALATVNIILDRLGHKEAA